MSCIMKSDMGPYLPEMVKQMVASLQSSEGLTVSYVVTKKKRKNKCRKKVKIAAAAAC